MSPSSKVRDRAAQPDERPASGGPASHRSLIVLDLGASRSCGPPVRSVRALVRLTSNEPSRSIRSPFTSAPRRSSRRRFPLRTRGTVRDSTCLPSLMPHPRPVASSTVRDIPATSVQTSPRVRRANAPAASTAMPIAPSRRWTSCRTHGRPRHCSPASRNSTWSSAAVCRSTGCISSRGRQERVRPPSPCASCWRRRPAASGASTSRCRSRPRS